MRSAYCDRFQSTPPRGGDHDRSAQPDAVRSFNPRPRAGGDRSQGCLSTRRVSIHAPARGATSRSAGRRRPVSMFQSTPPRGGRPGRDRRAVASAAVSIHAPAGGATPGLHGSRAQMRVSIHAPARGATTRPARERSRVATLFQSTPPRGGRPISGRSHLVVRGVSIHAPAGGRRIASGACDGRGMFQSTPPRGGRRRLEPGTSMVRCFNPRPRGGATAVPCFDDGADRQFQSTPPRGGRLVIVSAALSTSLVFQSTPPRGGDGP